ncbi:MAG: hypothetical protein JXO22_18255 [Phycisphaerae bacterium]|nr:hypothetical protein [Phycisphaerae bacterium]
MHQAKYRRMALMVSICVGTLFSGTCSGITSFVTSLNPCGTILDCDATEYNFVASGYEGPGVDFDVDPTCTYPPYCGPNEFTPAP